MSQSPLPPEVEALLTSWRGRLPIGTELSGYVHFDPDAMVLLATQPSMQRGQQQAASVWIGREAIEDHGQMQAVSSALAVLTDLALRRALPTTSKSELAPMVALMDSAGLTRYAQPQPSPRTD